MRRMHWHWEDCCFVGLTPLIDDQVYERTFAQFVVGAAVSGSRSSMLNVVPITLEPIVEEPRHWPPEKLGELVGRLTEELHTSDPEIEAASKQETRRRLAEIENGTVQPVDGKAVSARIRQIVGR